MANSFFPPITPGVDFDTFFSEVGEQAKKNMDNGIDALSSHLPSSPNFLPDAAKIGIKVFTAFNVPGSKIAGSATSLIAKAKWAEEVTERVEGKLDTGDVAGAGTDLSQAVAYARMIGACVAIGSRAAAPFRSIPYVGVGLNIVAPITAGVACAYGGKEVGDQMQKATTVSQLPRTPFDDIVDAIPSQTNPKFTTEVNGLITINQQHKAALAAFAEAHTAHAGVPLFDNRRETTEDNLNKIETAFGTAIDEYIKKGGTPAQLKAYDGINKGAIPSEKEKPKSSDQLVSTLLPGTPKLTPELVAMR